MTIQHQNKLFFNENVSSKEGVVRKLAALFVLKPTIMQPDPLSLSSGGSWSPWDCLQSVVEVPWVYHG